MAGRKLVFARHLPDPSAAPAARVAPAPIGSPLTGLFGGLKGTVHIEPGTDLTLPSTAPIYLYESIDPDLSDPGLRASEGEWLSSQEARLPSADEEFNPMSNTDRMEEG